MSSTKPKEDPLPTAAGLQEPLLHALSALGGTATIAEIEEQIARGLSLTPKQVAAPHDPKRGGRSELSYRLAWTRSRLKKAGLIERTEPRTWRLTVAGKNSMVGKLAQAES